MYGDRVVEIDGSMPERGPVMRASHVPTEVVSMDRHRDYIQASTYHRTERSHAHGPRDYTASRLEDVCFFWLPRRLLTGEEIVREMLGARVSSVVREQTKINFVFCERFYQHDETRAYSPRRCLPREE